MDIKQQIEKFDAENNPFYMVDHEDGVYLKRRVCSHGG